MDSLSSFVKRVRQNHALEHATVHLLTRSDPSVRVVGRSDWTGFSLYGQVDTQDVLRAATEALGRLTRGEAWLAVHPRCGTNLAVAGLLVGGLSYASAASAARSRLVRWARVALTATAALAAARPLGFLVQRRIMTTTDLTGVRIERVSRQAKGELEAPPKSALHETMPGRRPTLDAKRLSRRPGRPTQCPKRGSKRGRPPTRARRAGLSARPLVVHRVLISRDT